MFAQLGPIDFTYFVYDYEQNVIRVEECVVWKYALFIGLIKFI